MADAQSMSDLPPTPALDHEDQDEEDVARCRRMRVYHSDLVTTILGTSSVRLSADNLFVKTEDGTATIVPREQLKYFVEDHVVPPSVPQTIETQVTNFRPAPAPFGEDVVAMLRHCGEAHAWARELRRMMDLVIQRTRLDKATNDLYQLAWSAKRTAESIARSANELSVRLTLSGDKP